MKKLALVLGLVALTVSCKKEVKDCECHRVVEVEDMDYVDYKIVSTVNDCSYQTKMSIDKTGVTPVVGECYTHVK